MVSIVSILVITYQLLLSLIFFISCCTFKVFFNLLICWVSLFIEFDKEVTIVWYTQLFFTCIFNFWPLNGFNITFVWNSTLFCYVQYLIWIYRYTGYGKHWWYCSIWYMYNVCVCKLRVMAYFCHWHYICWHKISITASKTRNSAIFYKMQVYLYLKMMTWCNSSA